MFKLTVTVEPAFAAPAAAGYAAAAASDWPRCCIICNAYLGRHNVFPTCGVCYNAAMDAKKQSEATDNKKPVNGDNKDGEDKTMNADAVGDNKDGEDKTTNAAAVRPADS